MNTATLSHSADGVVGETLKTLVRVVVLMITGWVVGSVLDAALGTNWTWTLTLIWLLGIGFNAIKEPFADIGSTLKAIVIAAAITLVLAFVAGLLFSSQVAAFSPKWPLWQFAPIATAVWIIIASVVGAIWAATGLNKSVPLD